MKSKNKRKDIYKMNSRRHNRWYSILLSLFLVFSLMGCNENLQMETNQTTDEAVVVSQEAEITEEPEVEENTDEQDQSETESQDGQLQESSENNTEAQASSVITTRENIPDYEGYAYIAINDNQPYFSDEDKQRTDAFEEYSELDTLGRCGVAYANICKELQPTEPRGKIGMVKPSGWHTVKYNDIIDGNYLYNRCHLIGFQLAGENANPKNLITGTRYLNVVGMLPFENAVDNYVEATGNHVLYRVTPVFTNTELVARGVLMEAYSVEDQGAGIKFCYYVYNIQPGIGIDYQTGDSWEDASVVAKDNTTFLVNESGTQYSEGQSQETKMSEDKTTTSESEQESESKVWISATGSKYHSKNNCGRMDPSKATQVTKQEAIDMHLGKCSKCW